MGEENPLFPIFAIYKFMTQSTTCALPQLFILVWPMLKMISTIKVVLFFDMISWYFFLFWFHFLKNSGIACRKSLDKKIYQKHYWVGNLDISLLRNYSFPRLTSSPTAIFPLTSFFSCTIPI